MAFVFIPALVTLLVSKEKEKGLALTRNGVEAIHYNATAITLPEDIAFSMVESRGYNDMEPEDVWNARQAFKSNITQ
ncbi:hypothetical protein RBJ15_10665 [Pantoea sp. BS_4]|uniref:Uncharacterized protein n=1 Tax=Pantoea stewartii TaxID=66269 RepID=A0AB34VB94_9GAMM|nr:hypothetical protein [Pantoea stewartii]KTS70914.1 hypothetical protein RSA30_20515 [Pantoea stewartii]KTS93897.1 hypothetical protein RSA13_20285 [Pantoea stewartii]KTT06781.1 hypothetical protein RSA36_14605 [Pantoea stewartii]MDF7787678.1 hypothetical protein [Pantoea stewartii]